MSIPIQTIEELLSVAYVNAVVARAGATCDIVGKDFGIDMSVRRVDSFNGQKMDMGVAFECQLKASINWIQKENHIAYDLDADTYKKLIYRHENSTIPCFLIVMCLPRNENKWLEITEDYLTLRNCCYYRQIEGKQTKNKSTIRIKIPREQLLTPEAVKSLINRISAGEIL